MPTPARVQRDHRRPVALEHECAHDRDRDQKQSERTAQGRERHGDRADRDRHRTLRIPQQDGKSHEEHGPLQVRDRAEGLLPDRARGDQQGRDDSQPRPLDVGLGSTVDDGSEQAERHRVADGDGRRGPLDREQRVNGGDHPRRGVHVPAIGVEENVRQRGVLRPGVEHLAVLSPHRVHALGAQSHDGDHGGNHSQDGQRRGAGGRLIQGEEVPGNNIPRPPGPGGDATAGVTTGVRPPI